MFLKNLKHIKIGMTIMEEKFEKILLDNTIFNKKEFMEKYSPWA